MKSFIATLALAAAPAPPATAEDPLQTTQHILENARKIADSELPHNQKLDALRRLLADFLDTDAMAEAALGTHRSDFTAAQDREFRQLFRELFQRTYVQKILLFEHPHFAYVGQKREDAKATVETKIITPKDEFLVLYRLQQKNGRWIAEDIQVEDLSLTQNFRRDLDRLLTQSSVEDLLDRMRRKYGTPGEGQGAGL